MLDIGDLVICIDDNWLSRGLGNEKFPTKGNIYTIRGFTPGKYDVEGITFLVFEEIVNPIQEYRHGKMEICFSVNHFKPIKKPKIDGLRELLVKPPVKEIIDEMSTYSSKINDKNNSIDNYSIKI